MRPESRDFSKESWRKGKYGSKKNFRRDVRREDVEEDEELAMPLTESLSKLEGKLNRLISPAGLQVYHLERYQIGKNAYLRVVIEKIEHGGSIGINDCVYVSSAIAQDLSLKDVLNDFRLEVSSPGVNRKLTRPEHYRRAVGEILKIKLFAPLEERGGVLLRGELKEFGGGKILLSEDDLKKDLFIELSQIKEAKVEAF